MTLNLSSKASPNLIQLVNRLASSLIEIEQTKLADASVLLAITDETHPKILLTRRASHMNSHAGEVSFPGGKYEVGDTSNIDTALRETQEETQLPPSNVQVIGQLPFQTSKAGLTVCPIIAIIPAGPALVADESEIAHIFWAELNELIAEPPEEYLVSTEFNGKPVQLKTPSWRIDEEVVWGLTGRIIANLLKTVFDKEIDWYYNVVTK